jgi:Domain of unknown function(DUF2779)/Domain of unknown function DUF83
MLSISKTHYTRWRGCAKNAWLSIHKPELFSGIELSEYDRSVMESGIEVEQVARNLFSGGVLVTGSPAEARRSTAELVAQGTSTLFQAQFERDQLLAAIDVLRCDSKSNEVSIYEIKSSTKVKEEHIYDLAFQVMLLRMHGFNVGRAFLIHLNPDYVRQGDLDIQQLFITVDMTGRIDLISGEVATEIRDARKYLLAEAELKGPCSCIYRGRANHCSTFVYSNPDVPSYSVHDISHIGNSPNKLRALIDAGVFSLGDVPEHIVLNASQKTQVRVYRSGETVIEKEAIERELAGLAFPLHFIDYETFSPALPRFTNYSPHDRIPVQYSLHIVGAPTEEPIHRDFLFVGSNDPTADFLSSLQQHVGSFGAIIVWNKTFESQVNDAIARRVPEAKNYGVDFYDRLYDLKDIFSKQYFVHKNLYGKVSIKQVLPVLAPELSYSALKIQDGTSAATAWSKIMSGELSEKECADLREQLKKYCSMDSYGMYAIWRALIQIVEGF